MSTLHPARLWAPCQRLQEELRRLRRRQDPRLQVQMLQQELQDRLQQRLPQRYTKLFWYWSSAVGFTLFFILIGLMLLYIYCCRWIHFILIFSVIFTSPNFTTFLSALGRINKGDNLLTNFNIVYLTKSGAVIICIFLTLLFFFDILRNCVYKLVYFKFSL